MDWASSGLTPSAMRRYDEPGGAQRSMHAFSIAAISAMPALPPSAGR